MSSLAAQIILGSLFFNRELSGMGDVDIRRLMDGNTHPFYIVRTFFAYTKTEVAHCLNLSLAFYKRIESGEAKFTKANIHKFCELFGITPLDLIAERAEEITPVMIDALLDMYLREVDYPQMTDELAVELYEIIERHLKGARKQISDEIADIGRKLHSSDANEPDYSYVLDFLKHVLEMPASLSSTDDMKKLVQSHVDSFVRKERELIIKRDSLLIQKERELQKINEYAKKAFGKHWVLHLGYCKKEIDSKPGGYTLEEVPYVSKCFHRVASLFWLSNSKAAEHIYGSDRESCLSMESLVRKLSGAFVSLTKVNMSLLELEEERRMHKKRMGGFLRWIGESLDTKLAKYAMKNRFIEKSPDHVVAQAGSGRPDAPKFG